MSIKNLNIEINDREHGVFNAVSDLDLHIGKGSVLGIVGESGSGKTVTALALMGLNSKDTRIASGSIDFNGIEISSLKPKDLSAIRGEDIAMIFQDPMTSLNPLMRIGKQVEENLLLHTGLKGSQLKEKAIGAMQYAGLKEAEEIYRAYPHQLSGGMRQRVMIASAIICRPKLLIADEPTTALDSTIQIQILELFKRMKDENDMAMVFISHDLWIIGKISDFVVVMYRGFALEYGSCNDIIQNPYHPYTKALIKSIPTADKKGKPLYRIKSDAQEETDKNACPFASRCDYVQTKCYMALPAWQKADKGRRIRCIRFGEI